MNAARSEADLYETFQPKEDSLFFKIGYGGIISFHGSNCNIRKRLTSDELGDLIGDGRFLQAASGCYVNLDKIRTIEDRFIRFGDDLTDKCIAVSARGLRRIRRALTERRAVL